MSTHNTDPEDWATLLDESPDVATLELDNGDLVLHEPGNETAWLQGPLISTEAVR